MSLAQKTHLVALETAGPVLVLNTSVASGQLCTSSASQADTFLVGETKGIVSTVDTERKDYSDDESDYYSDIDAILMEDKKRKRIPLLENKSLDQKVVNSHYDVSPEYVRGENSHRAERDVLEITNGIKNDGTVKTKHPSKHKGNCSKNHTPTIEEGPEQFPDHHEVTKDKKVSKQPVYMDHKVDLGFDDEFEITKKSKFWSYCSSAVGALAITAGTVVGALIGNTTGGLVGFVGTTAVVAAVQQNVNDTVHSVLGACSLLTVGKIVPKKYLPVATMATLSTCAGLRACFQPHEIKIKYTHILDSDDDEGWSHAQDRNPDPEGGIEIIDKRSVGNSVVDMRRSKEQLHVIRREDIKYYGPLEHKYITDMLVDATIFNEITSKYWSGRFTEGLIDSAMDYGRRLAALNTNYGQHGQTLVNTVYYMRDWMSYQLQKQHADDYMNGGWLHQNSIFLVAPVVQ